MSVIHGHIYISSAIEKAQGEKGNERTHTESPRDLPQLRAGVPGRNIYRRGRERVTDREEHSPLRELPRSILDRDIRRARAIAQNPEDHESRKATTRAGPTRFLCRRIAKESLPLA